MTAMDERSRADAAPWAGRGSVFSQAGLARPVAWATPHDLDRLRASHGHRRLGRPLVPTSVASPRLGDELFARLLSYGTAQETHRGDVLFRPGDEDADLIVVARGSVEVVRTATADVPAATVAVVDAGGFVGELNLLTGQNVYLLCRVRGAGTVYRVSPERLRQLMATDVELSDIVFKALIARRELLQRSTAALAVEIVGGARSAAALALRTYAARQRLIHLWFDADTPAGRAMMESSGLTEDDLPAVVMPGTTLKQATPGGLAEKLGLSYRRSSTKPVDVTIVGAGPAGLAAAVYGASEGLDTVLLDGVGTGGQAAASSRIENYFGFPFGLSGADLTGLAVLQALKFGAQLASPCQAVKLDTDRNGDLLRLHLQGGEVIDSKAVVIATGARYRVLPLGRWPDFEGAGIYYAATELEARGCMGSPVTVVGGANSAGQAALYLAGRGSEVSLVVRGPDIAAEMSAYLVQPAASPSAGHGAVPERGYPAGRRRLPPGSQHHRPDDRQHASPAVLGLVLLHRRRTRHELADRDRYRGRWVHPDRRSAERRRSRAGLGHAETAAASVRDQHPGRVRRRRRPLRLDEAGRRSYRRGRQRDRLSPQGHQHARLTTDVPGAYEVTAAPAG